jgi:hypothetical protein
MIQGGVFMNLKNLFDNAPREYGVFPIIHQQMDAYQKVIDKHDANGFAGVVANVAYDESFPDNSEAWKNVETGCRAYIARGMKCWIYDEKGYPSGTAGGAVLDRNPEYEGKEIMCFAYWKTLVGKGRYRSDIPSGKLFRAYLVPLGGSKDALDISGDLNKSGTLHFAIPDGAWRLVILVERRMFDATHAAHSYSEPRRYIDLFNPEATRAFLKVTHEKYKAALKDEFGKGIKAFFTDEPSLIGWNIPDASYPILTWSDTFPVLFKQRYGYDIGRALLAVFLQFGANVIKYRCDFWELTSDMLADSFFGEIQKWCKTNGIASSGHFLEEELLIHHVYCYGSFYRSMKRMDYPGIDQLCSEPSQLMNASVIPIARLIASFADVYDLGETFTEASDHSSRGDNRQISMDWIRASMNWHFALGINNITSYYNFDYFSQSDLVSLNKYVSCIGNVLRQGKRYSKTAVLYPEYAMWASFTPTEKGRNKGQDRIAEELGKTFASVSWELLHRQIDYDYIDEEELVKGDISGGNLLVQKREYSCLVLPCADVMSLKGLEKLLAFIKSGGKIVFAGSIPRFDRETGNKNDLHDQLLIHAAEGKTCMRVDRECFYEADSFLPRLMQLHPEDIQALLSGHEGSLSGNQPVSANILSHVRKTGDGFVIFLCNMGCAVYRAQMEIKGTWQGEKGDPLTSAVEPAVFRLEGSSSKVDVVLKAYESIFFLIKPA